MKKQPIVNIQNGILQGVLIPNDCHCTDFIIPDSVTKIDRFAFYGCQTLQSIIISDSVTEIGPYAFSHCSSLTSIQLPNSIQTIDDYAFDHCTSLQSIILPNSIVKLGAGVFSDCHSLISVDIPGSIQTIGNMLCHNCTALQTISVPSHLDYLSTFNYELQCAKENIPVSYLYLDRDPLKRASYELLHELYQNHSNFNSNISTYQIRKLLSYLHNHVIEEINFSILPQLGLLDQQELFTNELIYSYEQESFFS